MSGLQTSLRRFLVGFFLQNVHKTFDVGVTLVERVLSVNVVAVQGAVEEENGDVGHRAQVDHVVYAGREKSHEDSPQDY